MVFYHIAHGKIDSHNHTLDLRDTCPYEYELSCTFGKQEGTAVSPPVGKLSKL